MTPHPSLRFRLAMSDTWLLEVFLSLYTIIWGAWFLNPFSDAFNASATAYAILREFPGGEAAFGGAVVALGTWKLIALARWSAQARSLACAFVGIFWLIIALVVGIPTHWLASQIPAFLLVAFANWFCWIRLSYRGAS